MARIEWDQIGNRRYEYGVDRGVIYPTRAFGYVWNGLTSVVASPAGSDVTPKYIDGIKYYDRPGSSEFAGTINAFTYPDQFEALLGLENLGNGLHVDQQRPKLFDLSYRTGRGSDGQGNDYGYRIHIVYNALIPTHGYTSNTVSQTTDLTDFSWTFTTTPVAISGKKHSAHLMIDSVQTNKYLLADIEKRLYGTDSKDPYLPSPSEMVELFDTYKSTGYGFGKYGHTTYGHGSEY